MFRNMFHVTPITHTHTQADVVVADGLAFGTMASITIIVVYTGQQNAGSVCKLSGNKKIRYVICEGNTQPLMVAGSYSCVYWFPAVRFQRNCKYPTY